VIPRDPVIGPTHSGNKKRRCVVHIAVLLKYQPEEKKTKRKTYRMEKPK